jgi:hypothetical protein
LPDLVELQLVDVQPTQIAIDILGAGQVWTMSCSSTTMRALEPAQQDWVDVGYVEGIGSYLDGQFVSSLGCDVLSCEPSDRFWFTRMRAEQVDLVQVAPIDEFDSPPQELPSADAGSSSFDAGSRILNIPVYETRTLTGRVRVTIGYWTEATCSGNPRTIEGDFDLGD